MNCIRFPVLIGLVILVSCSRKIYSERPFLAKTVFRLDSLPESEINIPIQIDLKPLYAMAEKNVDTVFTSPNWPDDWVQTDCSNRYKYHFRRSPLKLSASGNAFNIGFTGFYKIIGSTRVCIGRAVVSPWTPACRCGFDEGERRVKIAFSSLVNISPEYTIKIGVRRHEPEPIDNCTVCFFGADITSQVMAGLNQELELAKKNMEDSFGSIDLKDQVQAIWDQLTPSYDLKGHGWLQINPRKIRLNSLFARNDSLNIFLGLTANPVIRFEKTAYYRTVVPRLDNSLPKTGFNIFLDAILDYDSLSKILNKQIAGKEFAFKKGPLNKTVIVRECQLYGMDNERMVIRLRFGGSNEGIIYFTGIPVYDERTKMLEVRDIDFDLKSKNLLLGSAEWMFNRRIINEISDQARFDLSGYIDTAMGMINQQLNKEWIPGIKSSGMIYDLSIMSIYPMSTHLYIRSYAKGDLLMKIDAGMLNF